MQHAKNDQDLYSPRNMPAKLIRKLCITFIIWGLIRQWLPFTSAESNVSFPWWPVCWNSCL